RFIYLDANEVKGVREAQKLCSIRGWQTRDYEKFYDIMDRLKPFFPNDTISHYFFKMSSVSPKDMRELQCYDETAQFFRSKCNSQGQYRKMCIHSPQEVIYALCMSERLYITMKDRPVGHNIILRDWINADPELEFRCFVYNGYITAISQYHSATGYRFDKDTVKRYGQLIVEFWENEVKNKLIGGTGVSDWTVDIGFLPNGKPNIVELNGFGAYLVTGAAQYCWEKDYHLIHRVDGKCTIRHLIDVQPNKDNPDKFTYIIGEQYL
ncbi:MAG: cell division cycle protein 123-like protein, partial [Barrevirus sp.]